MHVGRVCRRAFSNVHRLVRFVCARACGRVCVDVYAVVCNAVRGHMHRRIGVSLEMFIDACVYKCATTSVQTFLGKHVCRNVFGHVYGRGVHVRIHVCGRVCIDVCMGSRWCWCR